MEDRQAWKFVWLSLRKELISWQWLVFLLVGFTESWWIWPAVYFFLWSYRLTPSGLIVWLTILVLSAWTTAAIGALVVRIVRIKKPIAAARLRFQQGLPGAEEQLNALKHRAMLNVKTRKVMLAYAIAHFAIPAYIATVLWNDIKQPPITSFKHPIFTTPRQRLDKTLGQWQKRGIYLKFQHEE